MNTKEMRRIIVHAAHHAKHGHMPSALSLVEILKAYSEVQQKEDEIVLSKGHGCLHFMLCYIFKVMFFWMRF